MLSLRRAVVIACLTATLLAVVPAVAAVQVTPATVSLRSPEATEQLLVAAPKGKDRSVDLTRSVNYRSTNPAVATVTVTGVIQPRGEGAVEVIINRRGPGAGAELARVPVRVTGLKQPAPVSFEHEIIPILTRAGCNSGGCHGKAEGKNGFKLSVFGFDPAADHEGIVLAPAGRRVTPARPETSLLLRKATARIPHAGGKRLDERDPAFVRLYRWIAEGARYSAQGAAPVARIEVSPSRQTLGAGGVQQVRVTAIDSQGRRRCVTAEAEYQSNAGPIAEVDRDGWVRASGVPGEAAILARYMGQVAVCRVTIPQSGVSFTRPAESNFVDTHVWNKLQQLGIPPSEAADDATFMRRAYLDVIGTLPTADEARRFLDECRQERQAGKLDKAVPPTPTSLQARPRLVDSLLSRPEYADYWAMRWADLLRVDKEVVGHPAAVAFTRWLRRQFAENRPYDEFAREVVTAQGATAEEGPAALFRVLDKPEESARAISQLFLGVRIECAQCHHHPSDRWGQEDYFAFAGFFTGIGRKQMPSGGDAILVKEGLNLKHPRTGQTVTARVLGGLPAELPAGRDRRTALAEWMVSKENPYFARVIANRLWAHYFGRGLVEPLDDLRATNPATNEPLLDALANHLREVRYDLKAFTRTLLASRVYALGATTTPKNANDSQNFSHAAYRPLPAEVLLDAICQATGVTEKFTGWPEGYRAIQVWDNRIPSYFFRIFGRPVRASVCECERSSEPSIAQALHLMNSPEINAKIRDRDGTARRLADTDLPPERVVEELFLGTLSRPPTVAERTAMTALLQEASSRREGVEDVLWALLNSREFVFNH